VKVLRSYGGGIIDAILEPKMMFVLWLRNFIFGLFIFYLLLRLLSGAMGKTVFAESLSFDINILFDLLVHHGQSYSMIISAGIILIVLYFLVSIFLYGGILSILTLPPEAKEEKRRFAQIFFQGAGKYFGRFFRLSIYSLLLWAVFILINLLLNPLGKLLTGDGTNERTAFYLLWIRLAIGLFLVFLIRMILDYSRIEIVILDSRSIFLSLFKAIKFVFQNFGKTLALYYLLVLTGIALISVFWLLKSYLPSFSSPWLTILVPLVVAQLYIFFRAWLKIAFQSAQLVFYIRLSAI
jgi:hypothetical protein